MCFVHSADFIVFFDGFLELLCGIVRFTDVILPEGGIVRARIPANHIAENVTSSEEVIHRFFRHFTVDTDLHPTQLEVSSGEVVQCRLCVLPETIGRWEKPLINVANERCQRRKSARQVLWKFHTDTDRVIDLSGLEERILNIRDDRLFVRFFDRRGDGCHFKEGTGGLPTRINVGWRSVPASVEKSERALSE